MANKKLVSVLSTAALTALISSAVATTAFAKIDGIVAKDAEGNYLNYDYEALKESLKNDVLGKDGAELYNSFKDGSVVSFHDDKVGFVDAEVVKKAAKDAALAKEAFDVNAFTESAEETVLPGTVYAAKVEGGKVVKGDEVKPTTAVAEELALKSVAPISQKTIEVKFNKPVEDTSKVTFTAKKDGNPVTIAETKWSEDKTTASLSVSYKLFSGKYVVTAKAGDVELVSNEVEIKESAVSKVEFRSDVAVLDSADKKKVTTSIKVLNQYGEDITKAVEGELQFTASKATGAITSTNGVVTLADTQEYKTDEIVVLTVVHPATGTSASKQLKVSAAVDIASIEIGDVVTDEKVKEMYLSTDKTLYKLPVVVKDQYGNEILNATTLNNELTKISSNDAIIDDSAVTFVLENGKTYLKLANGTGTPASGYVTLTLAAKSGKTAAKILEVKADGKVDTFTIFQPEVLVKANTEFTLPFEAYNQYGVKLTAAAGVMLPDTTVDDKLELGPSTSRTTITVTNATIKGTIDYKNGNALVIKVTPTSNTAPVTINVITAGGKHSFLTLNVQAEPKSVSISGLKSTFYSAIQAGYTEAGTDAIQLLDQYGDKKALTSGYDLTIAPVDGSNTKVTYAAGTFTASATTPGVAQFIATLKDDQAKTLDSYTFSMESVALKDITEFGLKEVGKIFTGGSAGLNVNHGNSLSEYNKSVTIYGKKGTTNVLVNQNLLQGITVNSPLLVTGTNTVDAANTTVNTAGADKTVKLSATIAGANGPIIATQDLTYSSAMPVVSDIKIYNGLVENTDGVVVATKAQLDGKKIAKAGDTTFRFVAKDQYGVESTKLSYIVTNVTNVAGATVTRNISITPQGVLTASDVVAGDSFVITASVDGVLKTLKVIVE